MANIVVGAYATEEEAAVAVQDFKTKGYKEENLTLLTSRDNTTELENQTDVHVEDANVSQSEENFMDKIKRALIQDVGPESTLSTFDRLIGYGLTEEQAREYESSLNAGEVVLIASGGEGSDSRTAPVADDNIDALDRTGRTNLADDDLASNSVYQNINADDREPVRSREGDPEKAQNNKEQEVLDDNPVLNKSKQERDGRSL